MKKHSLVVLGAAGLAVCWIMAPLAQPAPKPARAVPAYRSQGITLGFDDMMTMLVQPRHTKLYYAGAAKNWELAAAESRDLRQSFDTIAKAISQYDGNDVPAAVTAYITKKLNAVDAAIAKADPKGFAGAYKDLTASCNDCHHYMEHPYVVVKVPDAGRDTAHPDQDFNPNHP